MNPWSFILDHLSRNERVILLVVAESSGYSPAKAGFKMAVTSSGEMCGTVGGGKAEHDLVELAREMLEENRPAPKILNQVHVLDAHENSSGMICGGSHTAIIYPIEQRDLAAVESISRAIDGRKAGTLTISRNGIEWLSPSPLVGEGKERGASPFPLPSREGSAKDTWQYIEPLGPWPTAHIVGGGHVGLALSRILATLGFRIVVFDDRDNVDTMEQNTFAHEKLVMPFESVHKHIPDGEHSYVAIMTPSHRADEIVLRNLINRDLQYLGMMASPAKIEEIFAKMRGDGFSDETLAKVCTPIGLKINSHTPAEIAISIAAEMIKVKNTA